MRRSSAPAAAAALLLALLLAWLGGPPAAAAPPVPGVACGDRVTTDVRLAADLVCPVRGIVLAADGIDVNLNGHAILGPSAGRTLWPGVQVEAEGVTVRNGRISGFLYGVLAGYDPYNDVGAPGSATVRGVRLDGHGDAGLAAWGGGALTVRDAFVERNGVGARVHDGGVLSVHRSTVLRNELVGVLANGAGAGELVVTDTTVHGPRGGDGISCAQIPARLEGVRVLRHRVGVRLWHGCDGSVLRRSSLVWNAVHLELADPGAVTLECLRFSRSGQVPDVPIAPCGP